MNVEKIQFVEALKARTKKFTVDIINFMGALPKTEAAIHINRQLIRSGTSVGANCRARSKAEFFAKMSITIEEADESLFWLEVLEETSMVQTSKLTGY